MPFVTHTELNSSLLVILSTQNPQLVRKLKVSYHGAYRFELNLRTKF